MRWLTETPIAHRGLFSPDIPENSLAAFQAAVDQGFPIELDVHLLADESLAVFHDETLDRMTGHSGLLAELDRARLAELRLAGTDQRVPLLDEVLALVRGRVPLFVELKSQGFLPWSSGRIEDRLLQLLHGYTGHVAVMSFDPYVLETFAKRAPDIPRGQLAGNMYTLGVEMDEALRSLEYNHRSKPHFINYELSLLPCLPVERCRDKGLPLLCWTATTPQEFRRARKLCDNVFFEGFLPPR